MRNDAALVAALNNDWSPESLRAVALRVAEEIRLTGLERPVTVAHLPHSAVGNHLREWERHWDQVDWRLAHLLAPALALALAPAPASGSATQHRGSLFDCARIGQNINKYGGTEFCFQTPAFDVTYALHERQVPLPSDWDSWAPPGPGCRSSLFQMRPRWGRERHTGEAKEKALYTKARSEEGSTYAKELAAFHSAFVQTRKKTLDELLGLFPKPRVWIRRDTQSSLCSFARYLNIRKALLEPKTPLRGCRMYDKALVWPESEVKQKR
jgi:hypothetical protein